MRSLRLLGTLLCLGLAACGQSGATSPTVPAAAGAQTVTIVAKDNVFTPASYSAEGGRPIHFTFKNDGANIHEFEVKGLVPETKLGPGAEKSVDVPAPAAGTYRVYCEIHGDAGMEGELTVK